jgi:hypothetical protein
MYTAVERLMAWCGLSWRHLLMLGFLYTVIAGVYATLESLDNSFTNIYNKLYGIFYTHVDAIELWTKYYVPVFVTPIIVFSGFLMMKYGRFAVIYGTLICMIACSPMVIRSTNPTMFSVGLTMMYSVFEPILLGGILIYAYESVPVKYRRIAVLSLGAFSSFGKLGFGVSIWLSGSKGYLDTSKPVETFRNESSIIIGVAMSTLLIPFLFGLFIRRDSPVSLVIRGFEKMVYKMLVDWHHDPSAIEEEKPPMEEDDFVYQVEIERERSFTDFKTMVVRKWPALLFLFLTGYSYQLISANFLEPYKYLAYDYIGGGFEADPIKGISLFNSCCFIGTISAIVYIHKFKTITIIPGMANLLMFIGATINATEPVFYEDGNPIEYELTNLGLVVGGQVVIWIGYTLAQFVWGLLVVEIVGGKYRPIFVMGQVALRNVTGAIIQAIYFKYNWDGQGLYIAVSVILGIISISYFYVFLGTNWFSRHDPSLEDDCDIAIDVLDEDELYEEEDIKLA